MRCHCLVILKRNGYRIEIQVRDLKVPDPQKRKAVPPAKPAKPANE